MRRSATAVYRCPYTKEPLALDPTGGAAGEDVAAGRLVSGSGRAYAVEGGIPYLIDLNDELFCEEEKQENAYYQASYQGYDAVLDWVFESFREDERTVRGKMVDLLELKPGSKVLETGAGTCRDSVHIAERLGAGGELYVQDLSSHMLKLGRERVAAAARPDGPRVEFSVGNAANLPFPDGHFDAAFHFGGLNLFTDKTKAIAEMARVVRVGGKVVFGDEGVAPWLRGTPHGKVLMNSSKLYCYAPPLECLPETARDAGVRWLLGSAYYVVDFRVGEGAPYLDLDLPIRGRRGGTHRSRYYGVMEGVTVEAKHLAEEAAARAGLSIHDWLDRAVRAAAAQTKAA
ncbi:class I SAM-dependent methyltransferase [Gemmata sp. JC673]|uniref:Class I SAM-dependent methyltransferase n=1 Tax=Gemmata algarum TaxID=2975278 RepID=A0ABU5EV79_9BACT|nr:class I SAM-dependent methyltransferase [Gemmata algarum]MDY3559070.1 class I SAM-dependent methyltransferase [Gemmata algarum]